MQHRKTKASLTFRELCMDGHADVDDILAFEDNWREMKVQLPLHEFLGFHELEYWGLRDAVLICSSRRPGRYYKISPKILALKYDVAVDLLRVLNQERCSYNL
jgi:hypothetical protein